jgi:nitroreductase
LDAYLTRMAEVRNPPSAVRNTPVEGLAGFRGMLVGALIQGMDVPTRNAWCRNQLYISLGILLASAAVLGIDACPMEGIDRAQYDSILGLSEKGLASSMVATLGYRSPADQYAAAPKVRFPKERVFIHI